MPRGNRYTEKQLVMLTSAHARQLERLSQHHEVSVPELVRTATCQHYGLPAEFDRQLGLYDGRGGRPL